MPDRRHSRRGRQLAAAPPAAPGPRTRLDLDDPDLTYGYRPVRAYKNAKLANLLFTYELERRHGGNGLHANALCPGFVPQTIATSTASENSSRDTGTRARLREFAYGHLLNHLPFAHPLSEAVDTYEHAALDPRLRGVGGRFYAESRPVLSSQDSYDPDPAQRLWDLTLTWADLNEPHQHNSP